MFHTTNPDPDNLAMPAAGAGGFWINCINSAIPDNAIIGLSGSAASAIYVCHLA